MFNLEFFFNVLSLGSLYALIALGLVVVYGILQLVNFAYGELIMVGGYAMFLLSTSDTHVPWSLIVVVTIVAAMITSYLTERVAFRSVREKSLTAMLITSFAVSTLLQNGALLAISPRARAVRLPSLFSQRVQILNVDVPMRNVLMVITSIVLLITLTLLLERTVLGIALRAAADNFQMTRMLGVPANLIISTAFVISGLAGGCRRAVLGRAHRLRDAHHRADATADRVRRHRHRRHAQPGRRGGRRLSVRDFCTV